MVDNKKRNRWIFTAALLGYALVALIAIAIGIGWFWNYMDGYEHAQPHVALEGYMEKLTAEYVADHSSELIDGLDHAVQSEEDCRKALQDALTGKFTAVKNVSQSDESHYVYTLRCGPQVIGTMEMENTGEQYGDFRAWRVTKETFDMSYLLGKTVSVTVPKGFAVSICGKTLGDEYITEDKIPFPLLKGMQEIHKEYSMPYCVTYSAGPFFGEPAFTVTDGNGNAVTIDENTDYDAYLPTPDGKKTEQLKTVTDTFIRKFIDFTNNKDDEPDRNYQRLKPYMVDGSALQIRMQGAIGDIKWSVDRYGELVDLKINNMVTLGDGRYLCDITYVSSYMTATGQGEVGREEISNTAQLVFNEKGGSLKAEAMLNK